VMRGWILYKAPQADLPQEAFEVRRLVDEAERCGLDVQVFTPEQFDLVVTRDDRKSVLVDGETVALPDFLLPRMGAGTTYFALAVIRHLERLGVHSFNSSASIETVRDKLYSHQILAESNLPVAKTRGRASSSASIAARSRISWSSSARPRAASTSSCRSSFTRAMDVISA
jgi:gamma-F420-2:alpha-L-glutamate ligase